MFYFDKRFDKEPIGVIILEGCTIELADEEQEMCAFKIVFHGEGRRTYLLGADSQVSKHQELEKVLSLASAGKRSGSRPCGHGPPAFAANLSRERRDRVSEMIF